VVDLKLLVQHILTNAGLHCLSEFPHSVLPRLQSPMISVGLKTQRLLPTAFGGFFGYFAGRTCTGFLQESVIRLDVFSPYLSGGSPCRNAMNDALVAILGGVANHSLCEVSVGEIYYDPDVDCFRCTALLTFQAHLFQFSES